MIGQERTDLLFEKIYLRRGRSRRVYRDRDKE